MTTTTTPELLYINDKHLEWNDTEQNVWVRIRVAPPAEPRGADRYLVTTHSQDMGSKELSREYLFQRQTHELLMRYLTSTADATHALVWLRQF